MSRIASTSLSRLSALAALCAAALLLPHPALAGAYTYGAGAGTQRTVNAGVLLLDPNIAGGQNEDPAGKGADDKDPYVFYILNQRIDVKPFGWNIVNPLAPPSVTSTVYQRWANRTPTAQGPTYQLGQTLTAAMAGYWEVPLETTAPADLSKFDVLFLNLGRKSPIFSAADGEKLRRFVDGGGTLWIENSGTAVTTPVPGLFFNLTFNNNGTAGAAYVPSFVLPPLIAQPYQLSPQELNTLGDKHIGSYYADNGNNMNPQDGSGRLLFATVIGNSAHNNLPVVAQAPYGAGEIVVTTTGSANAINEYAGGVDVGVGGNSGPFCGVDTQIAPTTDLKLVADIIASTGSHNNEHQNSHQSGNDTGSLPSAVQTWNYPLRGSTTAGGAVTNGHFAYAVVGTTLTAFDIYPGEDLTGGGDPDDGKKNFPDYDNGKPYDVVWAVDLKNPTSAPTVGFDKNNNAVVLVEVSDGSVQAYDAVTGAASTTLGPTPIMGAGTSFPTGGPIPAPTFYGGRIYAGEADGEISVYDVATAASKSFAVNPAIASGSAGDPILAAPTVGIVPGDSAGAVPTNDIVALCVTKQGLFSVFLGARGELLQQIGSNSGNYNTKLTTLTNSMMDIGGVQRSYTLDTYGQAAPSGATPNPSPSPAFFTGGPLSGQFYGDYDVDFSATPSNASLTRTYVGASAQTVVSPSAGTYTAFVSTPALDRLGNVYYTVTDPTSGSSTIVSVHDGPNQSRVHTNWRFLLPKAGTSPGPDADGANYDALQGYTFTTRPNGTTAAPVPSAPVVDAQGNVYVLATNAAGATAILSFNTNAPVSADALVVPGQAGGVTSVSITQALPPGGSVDEFGGQPITLPASQYSLSASGHIVFTDFSQHSGVVGTAATSYPDLNEPYPVTVGFTTGAVATTQNQNLSPLHTNLSWYTVFNGAAASGVTLVGGTLYFVDGSGFLNSIPADPAGAGFTVTNKFVAPPTAAGAPALVTSLGDTLVGPTAAVPSSSNGAMLVNGPNGVTAYTNQVTLVVDANRVLEMNASGDAEWAVDATTKTTLAGQTTPVAGGATGTGQFVTTTLELNRPTSLTELTANDYLVADTGNNRCVRFDRGGKVLWELTRFSDLFTKLTPGEPDTLNQPTSVQIRSESGTDANGNPETLVRYLISDTGNDRIVEVDDVFDQYGNYEIDQKTNQPEYHVLNWISHTHDVQGRDYRYQSAAYYASPISGKYYVVALITNKRIPTAPAFTYKTAGTLTAAQYAQAAPGLLAPANQDVAGGTIVLLDYDPSNYYGTTTGTFGANGQADGFIATTAVPGGLAPIAISTIKASLLPDGRFDLNGAGTQQTLYIRNPRYLKVVTKLQPPIGGGTSVSIRHYLLADDNGVWDLDGDTFIAQFGFTQADYQTVTTPISQDGVTGQTITGSQTTQVPFIRSPIIRSPTASKPVGIPFLPTAIQLTGSDTVGTSIVGRYLITNSYSQGEAANNTGDFGTAYIPSNGTPPTTASIPGFGGEVFEVHALTTGGATAYVETHDNLTGTPRYTGHTISRPSGTNTSPLSQPTFAYRLQF